MHSSLIGTCTLFHIARALLITILVWLGQGPAVKASSLPVGFIETDIASNWDNPVGIAFGKNSAANKERIYVWERWGRVWIVEDGVKLAAPLLDIREETADYGDYGLLGFALDPDFQENGYVYVLYVVDRHHLLYYGTPQYSSTTSIRSQATIGRLTRYTARRSDDFRTVDPASRKILLGETRSTGFPILHTSHGVGSLVFGTDGTLMVSCGDGASFNAMDNGGTAGGTYGPQALADGIITSAENKGAFRCQMLDSLSGKLLRLDPATGNGVPSNPYYQTGSPRSARSRIWSLGLRNPCRFTLQPGTGSHNAAEGDPGTFYIGDVGWKLYEDLQVADGPGQNFGWPLYEGYYQNEEYWAARPSGMNAADHKQPVVDWKHSTAAARAKYNGTIYNVGAAGSPVTGTNFGGNAACGSVWYTGTDFPAEWRNVFFQSDFSGQWIRAFAIDGQHQLTNARSFASGEYFVFLTSHPQTGGLYYCSVAYGSKPGSVRRISYAPGGNRPPVAVASVDRQYGASPLGVQFSSALSTDPDGTALTYNWNFGDGTTSTAANPLKTYTVTGPKRYDAMLTVRDAGGATASSAVVITVNNTPPVVEITTPGPGVQYPLSGDTTYNLTASVADVEHPLSTLTHQWQVTLVHDNHEHLDLVVNATTTPATFQALGNDASATYYYRINLRVTDPLGLTTLTERIFTPQAGSAGIVVNPDFFTVTRGGGRMLDVLANDHGAVTDADFSTFEILTVPTAGTVVPDPVSGRIRYLSNASSIAAADTFSYRLKTRAGTLSSAGAVSVTIASAATNNIPVALGDTAAVMRGQSSVISVLANDTDPGGALAPGSLIIHTRPVSGVLSVNAATGAVTYTHNNSALTADGFTYSIADAAGLRSDPTAVRITISAANGAPVLTNPGSQSSVRRATASLQLQASDPNGQPLTWSATGLPAGLTLNSGGLISGTVATAAVDSSVTVSVSDGALSASINFTWSIAAPPSGSGLLGEYFTGLTPGVNPPVLTRNDPSLDFDWDVGGPSAATGVDGFSARWTGELIPRYTETYSLAMPVDDGARVWIDNVLVLDKWLPIGQSGWHNFTVNLTAGRRTPFRVEYYEQWGGSGITLYWFSARQAWEVIPASVFVPAGGAADTTAPAATLTGPAGPVSGPFTVSVSFNEPVTGLLLTDFVITNGAATLLDTNGGANTLTVNPVAAGNVSVSLPAGRVQDGGGNGNTASNTFTVSYSPPANRAPAVTSPGNQSSFRGSIISLQLQGSDPDGQALTWSASGLPAGLAINAGNGLIGGTVSLTAAASYNVTVTARDPLGLTGTVSFTWTTAPVGGSGIRGEYYTGTIPGAGMPVLSRIDSKIDFDWGAGSPAANVPVDNFSVRWTADLIPAYTEAHTLTVAADNGVRVYVNNVLVIDGWASPGWRNVNVNLTAGQPTPLKVEYYEGYGGAGISLYWNSARQPWEPIPAARLVPPAGAPGSAGTLISAISINYGITPDPAGGAMIHFTRPLTTGTAATILEGSVDLVNWVAADAPTTVSRANTGVETVGVKILEAPHVHTDGTVHQHETAAPKMFYRLRLVESP
jgi:glucose/arabinose dehydrogenase